MKKALSVICLAAITFIACKKDKNDPDPEPQPVNVIGFWEGKYKDTSKDPVVEGYFAFELKADSSAIVYVDQKDKNAPVSKENASSTTETTFKHLKDSKKITFGYIYDNKKDPTADLSTSGTVNDAVSGVEGTWGDTPNSSNRGTYTVTKK